MREGTAPHASRMTHHISRRLLRILVHGKDVGGAGIHGIADLVLSAAAGTVEGRERHLVAGIVDGALRDDGVEGGEQVLADAVGSAGAEGIRGELDDPVLPVAVYPAPIHVVVPAA